jgi:hypothetical protein
MMTVREHQREQWRRFHLSHDIPTEFVEYVEAIATRIEQGLKASQRFADAAEAAFIETDVSDVPDPERFNADTAKVILLDIWEYAPQLRAWMEETSR